MQILEGYAEFESFCLHRAGWDLTGSSRRRGSELGGPLVGCRLKFSNFVGSRLNFSIFAGCRKISVNK